VFSTPLEAANTLPKARSLQRLVDPHKNKYFFFAFGTQFHIVTVWETENRIPEAKGKVGCGLPFFFLHFCSVRGVLIKL
jgi:hypothetical protein